MQFSKKFLGYLKNFSQINKNMMFIPGCVQTTVIGTNSGISFFARLQSDTDIPEGFALDDLSNLLNVVELFENPNLQIIKDKKLIITDEGRRVELTLTKPEFIKYERNPDRFKKPDGHTFKLEKEKLREILKVSSILKSPHVSFTADGVSVYMWGINYENSTASSIKLKLGECTQHFNAVIEKEILRIVDSDYEITISSRGILYLTNGEIEYIIPLNQKFSTF